MCEFNWGDPHPLATDLRKRKHEADKRAARKFVDVLSTTERLYLQNAVGVHEGLALYDREATTILHGQAWAARAFAANPGDTFAAEACRDFALTGNYATDLRLHPEVRGRWQDACVAACRRLGDKGKEGQALNNLGVAGLNSEMPERPSNPTRVG